MFKRVIRGAAASSPYRHPFLQAIKLFLPDLIAQGRGWPHWAV
jgi:hypothetical protein